MEGLLVKENTLKPCQDNVTAANTANHLVNVAYYGDKDKWLSACPVPCKQISYNANIRYFHETSFLDPSNKFSDNFLASFIMLAISYETLLIEEHEESLVYDITNFLAAAGGNLGLFLGFSCMSVFYGMIKIIKKIKLHKYL